MRHQKRGRKFGRDRKERKALFRHLIGALITYGKIETTVARAKAILPTAQKLVTLSNKGTNGAKRQIESFLVQPKLISRLHEHIAPLFKDRKGGYLTMIRIGERKGDASEKVQLSWGEEKRKQKTPVSDAS